MWCKSYTLATGSSLCVKPPMADEHKLDIMKGMSVQHTGA